MNKTHSIETKNGVGPDATNDGSLNVIYHISADDIKALEADGSLIQIDSQDCTKAGEWTDELRDLAPVDDIKDFSTYEKMLNWVFQNKRIKNVALSGPYGSGKSSIIETYLRRHEEIEKYALRVSMATFTCGNRAKKGSGISNDGGSEQGNSEISEDEFEEAILKQILYKVDPKKIPQSSYQRLCVRSRSESIIFVFFTLLLISLMVGVLFPGAYYNFFGMVDLFFVDSIFRHPFFRAAELILFVMAISLFVEKVYGTELSKMQLKELKIIPNTAIETRDEDSKSTFNRNLDEILYFFEKTKCRTVFFEDIDRLNNAKIFMHLHELNYLLNNDDVIKVKPIKFVYAIREDFFDAEEKTKFFEFIIPVIPVVNSTNASAKLIRDIRNARDKGIIHDINYEFAMKIGRYITDMRMLLNVYNEFLVYKQVLKNQMKHGLSDKKMFAMMAFKSMYPRDFTEIQAEKGGLKQAFIDKNKFIEKQVREIDRKIAEARVKRMEQMKAIRRQSRLSLAKDKELKQVEFSCSWDEKYYTEMRAKITGKSLKDLLNEHDAREVLSKSVSCNPFLVFLLSQGYIDEGYTNYINYFYAEAIDKEIVGEAERKFILNAKQQKPEALGFNYRLSMPSVVICYLDAEILGKQEVCNFDVFRELIKENEIENLRRAIKVLAVNPEVNWKFIEEFRKRESTEIAETFTEVLVDTWVELWDYISENHTIIDRDFDEIKKTDINMWRKLLDKTPYYRQDSITPLFGSRLYYFRKILLSRNTGLLFDLSKSINRYLKYNENVLQMLEIDKSVDSDELMKFDTALGVLNFKFKSLRLNDVSDEFVQMILAGNYYLINIQTIRSIVSYISGDTVYKGELDFRPYSTIINLHRTIKDEVFFGKPYSQNKKSNGIENGFERMIEVEDFLDYIQSRMVVFVKNVVLKQKRLKDNADDIIDMLQRLDGKPEIQIELIRKEEFILKDITHYITGKRKNKFKYISGQTHVWRTMVENDKIKVDWKNIISYGLKYNFDDTCKDYILRHALELNGRPEDSEIDQSLQNFLQSGFEEIIE